MEIWFSNEKIEETESNKMKKLCYRRANNSNGEKQDPKRDYEQPPSTCASSLIFAKDWIVLYI